MTPQEIKERSEQIALMKNYEISENKECFKLPNKNGWIRLEEFYTDWNWLMEAVEKIATLEATDDKVGIFNIIIDQMPDKEAVFIAISNFAKLYNEGKL